MAKKLNPNKSKIHRSYTMEEVAILYSVNKRTVQNWIQDGLSVIKEKKPFLILGTELRIFLRLKNKSRRTKCKLHELYCFRCRKASRVQATSIRLLRETHGTGRVFGECIQCGTKIHKFYSLRNEEILKEALHKEIVDSTKTHSLDDSSSLKLPHYTEEMK
ncbi:helix-turn-helix domain-containing protein [Rosenbergiella epipactidis]|uniref:helix-turn-helix domain-containing protein n=1 Tax=Rosenbergiella epipactidis TaxID=1544694 RepID=UPI001F500654|nr:helix-turn-helix domain-containing protein [Rosenbergiella epipactidis]